MAYAYAPFDWYETPLYYDIVFDAETELECEFLEEVHARFVPSRRRRLLEPACGSGRLVAAMARRGYRVTGFDISAGMRDFAERRLRAAGLRARVLAGRMEAMPRCGRFELACCFVSSFRYLLSEEHARAHLAGVAQALVPGGVYALGVHLTDYDEHGPGRERHVAERDGVEVVCNIQSGPPVRRTRRQAMRSRLLVREPGGALKRYQTEWQFRSYSARQMRRLLASVPALELVATYDFDYDLRRPSQTLGSERLDQVLLLQRRP
ncbi:class I SAM-dependent methyltransferase [Haliangium ochraceum]|nr:class I SAM-dependent methyltransferase [Haliangium ochraceum]